MPVVEGAVLSPWCGPRPVPPYLCGVHGACGGGVVLFPRTCVVS